ncbi:unnamed protein product [Diatraea saccharalis]|uniref:Transmembrane protein 199 n=1 Tax=Diatraea saccharalis TaxID=40085 RepID=A0A9N9RHN6_9NEOP|nr:unnamed protein product [Diatraea saccharalis]
MDLKGSLVDTNLRIYPSYKLKIFLENEKLGDDLPVNIGKLTKGETYKPKQNKSDSKPSNIYLNENDIKTINTIKDKIKVKDVNNSEHDNPDQQGNEKSVEHPPDKDEKKDSSEVSDDVKAEIFEKENVLFLTTSDIDWLYNYIKERRSKHDDIPYLHELLEGSNIELPKNEVIKRNPVLEARCVKLRAQQEAREYRKMTKGVDNVRLRFPEDSISYQLKQMNRQLIAIGQFIISIFAGFLFGFRGVEWMVGNLDFGFRLLLGVMCALIIALAEIYFLAKKLNEELNVPKTTQIGGPPTFVNDRFNANKISKHDKPHQD